MNFVDHDLAHHGYYIAPAGVEREPCRHAAHRCRIGPTSRRKPWSILVDTCSWCGRILRSAQDLDWKQYDWIRRSNRRR